MAMQTAATLKTCLTSRQSIIAIIGLGYVGLPLMLRFQKVGFKVLGAAYKKNVDDAGNHHLTS